MIFRFISRFFQTIVVIVVIVGAIYIGMTVFANCRPLEAERGRPAVSRAQYEVVIRNTGNVFYTDEYFDVDGIITLKGYWEKVGDDFKYRDNELNLDRDIFGTVIIFER